MRALTLAIAVLGCAPAIADESYYSDTKVVRFYDDGILQFMDTVCRLPKPMHKHDGSTVYMEPECTTERVPTDIRKISVYKAESGELIVALDAYMIVARKK